jgi:hypothetical protein
LPLTKRMHYYFSWSIILNIWCKLFFSETNSLFIWKAFTFILIESNMCSARKYHLRQTLQKNFEHYFAYQSMRNKTLRIESLKIFANKIKLITNEWMLEYLIQIPKVNQIYLYINKCKFRSFKTLMTKLFRHP